MPNQVMQDDVVNVAACLPEMARAQPNRVAIHSPEGRQADGRVNYVQYTYRELDRDSDEIAHGLEHFGIGRGVRTALMVNPGLDFFAVAFAMAKLGVVPVMVDPGMGLQHLKTCLDEAEPQAFIGIPKAHAGRLALGWGRATVKTTVTVGGGLGAGLLGGLTLKKVREQGRRAGGKPVLAETRAGELAAVMYTSGSTGVPKGVEYTHANFAAQIDLLRDLSDVQPGEIDLPTFPPFALFDPALGMTTVVPDMDPSHPATVDPEKIIDAVNRFKVTNTFASPAVLTRVARYGAGRIKMPSLKRVISAGAPVPADLMEKFLSMLEPDAQIITPYGATEALPVSAISSREILAETRKATDRGKGVCVGRAARDTKITIIPIADQPLATWQGLNRLPAGEIGEIAVSGPTVTRAYFKRDAATKLAKIRDDAGVITHRMGDVGYLDEQERLWFCGRKSERVVLSSQTLFTVPCEDVFNTHPQVFRTALVRVGHGENARPVLCVELEAGVPATNQANIIRALLEIASAHEHTSSIKDILFHPGFPVDVRHNAKIDRAELSGWAQQKLG